MNNNLIYHARVKPTIVTVVGSLGEDNKLSLAVARCSLSNRFNKHTGNCIASQRLKQGLVYKTIEIGGRLTNQKFVELSKIAAREAATHPETINGREYKGKKANHPC